MAQNLTDVIGLTTVYTDAMGKTVETKLNKNFKFNPSVDISFSKIKSAIEALAPLSSSVLTSIIIDRQDDIENLDKVQLITPEENLKYNKTNITNNQLVTLEFNYPVIGVSNTNFNLYQSIGGSIIGFVNYNASFAPSGQYGAIGKIITNFRLTTDSSTKITLKFDAVFAFGAKTFEIVLTPIE